jgi:poly(3-hydroxyalkanoate) synthetase
MARLEDEAAQHTSALGPLVGLTREDIFGAVAVMLRETASDPQRLMKHGQAMGEDMIKIMTGQSDLAPHPKDKRFQDPAWQYNPFMRAGMQYYLAVQKGAAHWLEDLELDELEKDRARFISNIVIDGLAPTNTLIGNPSAQKMAITSGGLSLIKGLKNAYDDMVNNKGMVSQVDKKPFKLGENIATSKGSVVLRTEMMELIQYAPTTDEVYGIPQLTIPPQINKMYINDLSPEKSVVKYQLDNGIQTFVISWKNPSREQGVWDMADYVRSCREAMEAVSKITGSKKVNGSAGCSGGQTASMLASKMASDEDDLVDHKIDLSKVTSDLFILGGVTDHITPWKATYRSTRLFGSKDVTYVLSHSGHMQAILNPPGNPKAKYYVHKDGNSTLPKTADEWLKGAEEVAGSWWPYWMGWLQARAGKKKKAPAKLGNKNYTPLDPAPGLYVMEPC